MQEKAAAAEAQAEADRAQEVEQEAVVDAQVPFVGLLCSRGTPCCGCQLKRSCQVTCLTGPGSKRAPGRRRFPFAGTRIHQ